MDTSGYTTPSGRLAPTINGLSAFIPDPLPPKLDLSSIAQQLSTADQKIGELRGIGQYLPNPYLLIRPLQRREAIASSNIEGTYTSLPELLILEYSDEKNTGSIDTREVFNYTTALRNGLSQLDDDWPVSNRMVLDLHRTLMNGLPRSRSGNREPGIFRNEQNFIGRSRRDITQARFVPPPPPEHDRCLSDLEIFINSDDMCGLTPLVFAAVAHYQFEAIHPFPDGNGRVGRLLIPLILANRGAMPQPLLYMSQFFEDNKDEYIDLMLAVSQKSDWLSWIEFFLAGISSSADQTVSTIKAVRELQEDYQKRCQQARSSALLLQIVDSLFERIAVTTPQVQKMTGLSYTAAQNNIRRLVEYGILKDIGLSSRPKFYFAVELLNVFEDHA